MPGFVSSIKLDPKYLSFPLQEGFSGPCDLMICFGTFHRLANVNTSLNSKTLDAKKEKRKLLGKNISTELIYNLWPGFSCSVSVLCCQWCILHTFFLQRI